MIDLSVIMVNEYPLQLKIFPSWAEIILPTLQCTDPMMSLSYKAESEYRLQVLFRETDDEEDKVLFYLQFCG